MMSNKGRLPTVRPTSTGRTAPTMSLARGEARKIATAMILRAVPFPEKIEGTLVGMGFFVAAEPRLENRIILYVDKLDRKGLPSFSIYAPINEVDERRNEMVKALAEKIGTTLDHLVDGVATLRIPTGSSLHYQGRMRMGESDDGASLCDRYSRVWGFQNLHVARNGVISKMTATNLMPHNVTLASIGAQKIADERRRVAEAAA